MGLFKKCITAISATFAAFVGQSFWSNSAQSAENLVQGGRTGTPVSKSQSSFSDKSAFPPNLLAGPERVNMDAITSQSRGAHGTGCSMTRTSK